MERLKNDFKNISLREGITYLMAIIFQLTSIIAMFIALFLPPPGELHSSIISLIGISSAFCGATVGICSHFDIKTRNSSSK